MSNAKINKLSPTLVLDRIGQWINKFKHAIVRFPDQCLKKQHLWNAKIINSQMSQKGKFWPFTLHHETLWWGRRMQVLDTNKKNKVSSSFTTHFSFFVFHAKINKYAPNVSTEAVFDCLHSTIFYFKKFKIWTAFKKNLPISQFQYTFFLSVRR